MTRPCWFSHLPARFSFRASCFLHPGARTSNNSRREHDQQIDLDMLSPTLDETVPGISDSCAFATVRRFFRASYALRDEHIYMRAPFGRHDDNVLVRKVLIPFWHQGPDMDVGTPFEKTVFHFLCHLFQKGGYLAQNFRRRRECDFFHFKSGILKFF